MPTYEYICNACDHEFELFQSMRDPVKRKCPKCARPKLERLIGTGAAVIFKGSGFYETDYRSDSYKKSAEAETKSSSSDGAGKDAGQSAGKDKGESKPPESKSKSDSNPKSAPESKPADSTSQPKTSKTRKSGKADQRD